jgi:Uma2 family endonuclease
MTIAIQKVSLAEFLSYEDGTDNRYELVDGDLKLMSMGTGLHGDIIEFLNDEFRAEIARLQRPWTSKQSAVSVQSPRGRRWDTCRIPDVTVLGLDQWDALRRREALITLDQPAPFLVVEVVSDSTKSEDYRAKYAEYGVLEIPEYWIVDPLAQRLTIAVFEDGGYTNREFRLGDSIGSSLFPELILTADQILAGRR